MLPYLTRVAARAGPHDSNSSPSSEADVSAARCSGESVAALLTPTAAPGGSGGAGSAAAAALPDGDRDADASAPAECSRC